MKHQRSLKECDSSSSLDIPVLLQPGFFKADGILVMVCGIIWLFGQNSGWGWINTTMLVVFMAAATRCIFLDIPAGWLLISVTATLSAWDLHQFMSRMTRAGRVEKRTELERLHLKRIMIVAGLGIVLGAIALAVELKLSFGWMLFFGIILFLCLNRIFDLLKVNSIKRKKVLL